MNLTDFIIIYLACGAPFAVYYFLFNRRRINSGHLILKTVLNFIFWIPLAAKFAFDYLFSRNQIQTVQNNELDAESNLRSIQKQLENIVSESKFDFYDFREVLNRYIGLTLALKTENQTGQSNEQEIFQIGNFQNAQIGAICLNRRNRQRLIFHQTNAADDFLQVIRTVLEQIFERQSFISFANQLAANLDDAKTVQNLAEIFDGILLAEQRNNDGFVRKTRNVLWNANELKPLKKQAISVSLPVLEKKNLPFAD